MKSFSFSYLSPLIPFDKYEWKDSILRKEQKTKYRNSYITDNIAAEKGHDMNCIGDYSIDLLGYTTTTVSLELKVKWFDSYSDGSKYITYTLSKL